MPQAILKRIAEDLPIHARSLPQEQQGDRFQMNVTIGEILAPEAAAAEERKSQNMFKSAFRRSSTIRSQLALPASWTKAEHLDWRDLCRS
jgi:hypothetical protein